jgi:DNA repair protein RadC
MNAMKILTLEPFSKSNQSIIVEAKSDIQIPDFNSIKNWSKEDKPREKMLAKGEKNLSDTEILTILIGNGTRNRTAFDLATDLLKQADYDLNKLVNFSMKEMTTIKGIGPAKALYIKAALSLAGRLKESAQKRQVINLSSAKEAFEYMKADFYQLNHEEFWITILNPKNRPLSKLMIAKGGSDMVHVDVKIIGKALCENLGKTFIAFHNHPSGILTPSQPDIDITKRLIEIGKLLGCNLIDHIIVNNDTYYSFADNGKI